jgi:hypothetical protein
MLARPSKPATLALQDLQFFANGGMIRAGLLLVYFYYLDKLAQKPAQLYAAFGPDSF